MDDLAVSFPLVIVAVVASALIAALVLIGIERLTKRKGDAKPHEPLVRCTFVFEDSGLIDHGLNSEQIKKEITCWSDLRGWLGTRFCDLPDELPAFDETRQNCAQIHRFKSGTPNDSASLTIACSPNGHTVTLEDEAAGSVAERHNMHVMAERANETRAILENAPATVFALDEEGNLQWGNQKFENLSKTARRAFLAAARGHGKEDVFRFSVAAKDQSTESHYEMAVLKGDRKDVFYSSDVTELVQADAVRTDCIQTLAKTFADLSTGLAVFDRDQRLVLFNPAILDLTDTPAEFLAARPHMMEFFDKLRDNQVMPEPKNYATWRTQISDMIASATHGHYSENWSLPGGTTYRLIGRPHPNGAVAFLIEDITDEMALTRQSRRQLETHQAILDAMDDAVAVIGADGGLLVSNASFATLLGFDPDVQFNRTTFKDVVQACRSRFPSASIWDELDTAVVDCVDAHATRLVDTTGVHMSLRTEPLPDGLFMFKLSTISHPVQLSA